MDKVRKKFVWYAELPVFILLTVLLSVIVAALSSVIAAYRLSRVDPGSALREGN